MKCISIHRPWISAILTRDKRVENRTWPCPRQHIGERIALHASKGVTDDDLYWSEYLEIHIEESIAGCIVATAIISACDRDEKTHWDADNQWHWRLTDIHILPTPIPFRGAQGLFDAPDRLVGES